MPRCGCGGLFFKNRGQPVTLHLFIHSCNKCGKAYRAPKQRIKDGWWQDDNLRKSVSYKLRWTYLKDLLGRECMACGSKARLEFCPLAMPRQARRINMYSRVLIYIRLMKEGALALLCRNCNASSVVRTKIKAKLTALKRW